MTQIAEPNSSELLRRMLSEDQSLRAFIRASVPDLHEAEDLQQEVWKTLCAKVEQYDPSRPLRPWIMGIARLQVLKWRQSKARNREHPAEQLIETLSEEAEEMQEELESRKECLSQCMKTLPEQQKKLLGLIYRDEFSQKEVARKLNRTVGALQMQLTRIRRALRDCIESRLSKQGLT